MRRTLPPSSGLHTTLHSGPPTLTDRGESKTFWFAYPQNASPSHLNVTNPTNSNIIVRSLPNVTQDFRKAHSITLGTLIYSAWAPVLRIHNISPQCLFNTIVTTGKDKCSPNQVNKPYGPPPVLRTDYVSLEVALPNSPSDPIDFKLVSPLGAREVESVMTQFARRQSRSEHKKAKEGGTSKPKKHAVVTHAITNG
ncbi:hypothetical protein DFH06DRAFT_1320200 [Mycena polygramma]|nr:hypothetical protein DFH06DRAFT_1320200 [Mycena polygramma]